MPARNPKTKEAKVMHEYKHGQLHSGSKTRPKVKNRKQAIAMSEAGKSRKDKKSRAKRLEGKPL